jgi:cytidine deaminase
MENPQNSHQKDLPALSAESQRSIVNLIGARDFRGRIAASDVESLLRGERIHRFDLMLNCVSLAQQFAQAPITAFKVGAVALGRTGSLYFGANVEFPAVGLALGIHAEQSAVANAFMHGETGLDAIATTAVPCGFCRQLLSEVTENEDFTVMTVGRPAAMLSTLLPTPFGPKDLGLNTTAFANPSADLRLTVADTGELTRLALEAAQKAYAPATGAISGIALKTKDGKVFAGPCLESVALNPGLSCLQTAIVGLILSGNDLTDIVSATLVELKEARNTQGHLVQAALEAIAPGATLTVRSAEFNR